MTKQLAGIRGVLGNYVTPQENAANSSSVTKYVERNPDQQQRQKKPQTRLGRPLGKTEHGRIQREKVTLRIDCEMISDYRDWSWDQRCQLGELVERALADYYRHRKSV